MHDDIVSVDTQHRLNFGHEGTYSRWVKQTDCNAAEHDHMEAQIVLPFSTTPLNLWAHDSIGNSVTQETGRESACVLTFEQPHRLRWRGKAEFVNIYFTKAWWERADTGRFALNPCASWDDLLVRQIGVHLRQEYETFGVLEASTIDLCSALIQMRLAFAGRISAAMLPVKGSFLPKSRLKPVIDLLHEHLQDGVDLRRMARAAGASVFHFARSFSFHYGCPPGEYLRRLRVSHAEKLLIECPDLPVSQIGAELGMCSAPHFSRVFSRYTGLSPAEYRRRSSRPR